MVAPLGEGRGAVGGGGDDDRRGEVDSVGFVGFWPRRLPLQLVGLGWSWRLVHFGFWPTVMTRRRAECAPGRPSVGRLRNIPIAPFSCKYSFIFSTSILWWYF
jgi:hypothetical protein